MKSAVRILLFVLALNAFGVLASVAYRYGVAAAPQVPENGAEHEPPVVALPDPTEAKLPDSVELPQVPKPPNSGSGLPEIPSLRAPLDRVDTPLDPHLSRMVADELAKYAAESHSEKKSPLLADELLPESTATPSRGSLSASVELDSYRGRTLSIRALCDSAEALASEAQRLLDNGNEEESRRLLKSARQVHQIIVDLAK